MPEPISSSTSGNILENYQKISSCGTRTRSGACVTRHPKPVFDTVQISQEAREKLRVTEHAQRNDRIRREELLRKQDEALKRSLEVLEFRGLPPRRR
jgi:hypothetical protein